MRAICSIFQVVSLLLVFSLSHLLVGCGSKKSEHFPVIDEKAPELFVEYGGCDDILVGNRCAVSPSGRTILVWARTDNDATLAVLAGEGSAISSGENVQGGRRFEVTFGPKLSILQVVAETQTGKKSVKTLHLVESRRPAVLASIDRLRKAGKLEESRRLFNEKRSALGIHGLSMWARICLSLGRYDASVSSLEMSMKQYLDAGHLLAAADDGFRLVYLLIYKAHDFERAREILDLCESLRLPSNEFAFLLAYNRAQLSLETGTYRQGLQSIRRAESIAERSKSDWFRSLVENAKSGVLSQVGRIKEAAAILDTMIERPESPKDKCQLSVLLENRAWFSLLQLEAGETDVKDPFIWLERARRLGSALDRCTWNSQANIALNSAWAHLYKGNHEAADKELEAFRTGKLELTLKSRLEQLDIEARIALKKKNFRRAMARYKELSRLGEYYMLEEVSWRALVGVAEVDIARGKSETALKKLERAISQTGDVMMRVPLGEGRAQFVAQRRRAFALQMKQLLAMDSPREALEAARRNRIRILDSISPQNQTPLEVSRQKLRDKALAQYVRERQELRDSLNELWRVPVQEMPVVTEKQRQQRDRLRELFDKAFSSQVVDKRRGLPVPSRDELWLFYFSLNKKSHLAFAMTEDQIKSEHVTGVEVGAGEEALSEAFLKPFGKLIDGHSKIGIATTGALSKIDFHALPWNGSPLQSERDVTYRLDIGSSAKNREGGLDNSEQRPRALVVLDPRLDLSGARGDADLVRRGLSAWNVEILKGPLARGSSFRDLVSHADLLHYAGHGRSSGFGGWESGLLLADKEVFELGDILALNAVPRTVVLLGCETGLTVREDEAWGMSVAEAFLLAGSEQVIGTTRPITDELAHHFSQVLYRQSMRGADGHNLSVVLRKLQDASGSQDWSAFRIFTR